MKVTAAAINLNCGKNFHFKLEKSDDCLIVLFKSRCTVFTEDGYIEAKKGDLILYDKDFCQEYFCGEVEFVHDFIRFLPDENFNINILPKLKINKILSPISAFEFENLIRLATTEFFSNYACKTDSLDLISRLLINKILELSIQNPIGTASKNINSFLELRMDIYSNPQNYNSVTEGAYKTNVSKSHFQALYKSYFGVSFVNDLITARVEKAKSFLKNTDKTVSEIATLCGYLNVEHFIRQFKKETGITPGLYRD